MRAVNSCVPLIFQRADESFGVEPLMQGFRCTVHSSEWAALQQRSVQI